MNKTLKQTAVGSAIALALLVRQSACATTIDFESPADGTILSTEYAAQGADFSGAEILNLSSSLNPSFPPHSGNQVVFDYSTGIITVTAVGGLWSSAGGYITGNRVITEYAYDSLNNLLGSVSTPGANYVGVGTGYSPNIFLNINASDIAYVQFHDDGDSFTLDDFSFSTSRSAPDVASTLPLLGLAMASLGLIRCRAGK